MKTMLHLVWSRPREQSALGDGAGTARSVPGLRPLRSVFHRHSLIGRRPPLLLGLLSNQAGPRLLERGLAFAQALGRATETRAGITISDDTDWLVEGVLLGGIALAWLPPAALARALRGGALAAVTVERLGSTASAALRSEGHVPSPDGIVIGAPLAGHWQARLLDALLGIARDAAGAESVRALFGAARLSALTPDRRHSLGALLDRGY